jgi:beta-mannosidase
MAKQIAVLFADEPKNLEDFVMASQISQAEALKFFIEKWRSEKGRRWGMLWWNLRDCWPIISDAVVDYYGRRKLAYDYIKASQREVCSIVTEPDDGQHQLVVVNDLPYEVEGSVCLRDGVTDQILGEASFLICANDKQSVASIAAVGVPSLWLMQTRINTCQQFVGNHYIAGPRPFELNQYRDWLLQIKANALCDVEYVR